MHTQPVRLAYRSLKFVQKVILAENRFRNIRLLILSDNYDFFTSRRYSAAGVGDVPSGLGEYDNRADRSDSQ